jgi:hypothetical protein
MTSIAPSFPPSPGDWMRQAIDMRGQGVELTHEQ